MTHQSGDVNPITESVVMDARKLLAAINNSAQSKIVFFENAVQKLGHAHEKNWRLAALHKDRVFFEDVDTQAYYVADHSKNKGGKVSITNIKQIKLHEEDKKPESFSNMCLELVESIESGDRKLVESAFNKIASSRFRSTTIPTSGYVQTKDNVVRHLQTESRSGYALGRKIVDVLNDNIAINEETGKLEGEFSTVCEELVSKIKFSKLMERKLVARFMFETARDAWKNQNFQRLVEKTAALISHKQLKEAIQLAAPFFKESQEFCLLNRDQWHTLVEQTLATRACFNEDLINDTAVAMYKTNLKVNRDQLVEAWQKTAQVAQHPVMLENVQSLNSSDDFAEAHDAFLYTILETVGNTTKNALLAGLNLLKQQMSEGQLDEMTGNDLDQLITNLREHGDTESVYHAMEALSEVNEFLEGSRDLASHDAMPGPLEKMGGADAAAGDETDVSADGGGDKPLKVTVEMDPVAMAKQDAPAPVEPIDDIDLEADPSDELGGETEGEEGEEGAAGDEDLLASLDDIDLEDESPMESKSKGADDVVKKFINEQFGDGTIVEFDDLDSAETVWGWQAVSDEQIQGICAEHGVDVVSINRQPDAIVVRCTNTATGEEMLIELPSTAGEEEMRSEVAAAVDMGSMGDVGGVDELDDTVADPMAAVADSYALPEEVNKVDVSINNDYATVIEEVTDSDVNAFNQTLEDPNEDDPDVLQAKAVAWVREHKSANLPPDVNPEQQEQSARDLAGKLVARRIEGRQMNENQYKSPLTQLARRGLRKAAVNKLVTEGELKFSDRTDNAAVGAYKGIKFTLDCSEEPNVLMNEDGTTMLNIPEELVGAARYIAELSDEEVETDAFVEWLDSYIESIRPINESEADLNTKSSGGSEE